MSQDYKTIPVDTLRNLVEYCIRGRSPGGFLEAVLSNDLRKSFERGDITHINALWAIITWVYNRAPSGAWGSPERVSQWEGLPNHEQASWTKRALMDTALER